jgi:hypothetical protein
MRGGNPKIEYKQVNKLSNPYKKNNHRKMSPNNFECLSLTMFLLCIRKQTKLQRNFELRLVGSDLVQQF